MSPKTTPAKQAVHAGPTETHQNQLGPDRQQVRYELRRTLIVPGVFGLSTVLAFINADLAKYSWMLIAVLLRLI